jgi:DNA invertase Pin-like site-specific DNA recombinase
VGRHRHQHRALDARGIGGLADVERDLIRTRTAEGRTVPRPENSIWGDRRPPRPEEQKEATQRGAKGATLDELARSYAVGIFTIRRATRAA